MRYSRISVPFRVTALVRASLAPGAAPGRHERLLRGAIAAQIPTDRLAIALLAQQVAPVHPHLAARCIGKARSRHWPPQALMPPSRDAQP